MPLDPNHIHAEVPHEQRIAIDVTEWPAIRAAINRAVKVCRDTGEKE